MLCRLACQMPDQRKSEINLRRTPEERRNWRIRKSEAQNRSLFAAGCISQNRCQALELFLEILNLLWSQSRPDSFRFWFASKSRSPGSRKHGTYCYTPLVVNESLLNDNVLKFDSTFKPFLFLIGGYNRTIIVKFDSRIFKIKAIETESPLYLYWESVVMHDCI